MARKKRAAARSGPAGSGPAAPLPAAAVAAPAEPGTSVPAGEVPGEVPGRTALVLAVMMALAPAVGVPSEEMLQDTLKSAVVSFFALGAALWLFLDQRRRREPLRWHALLWLPGALLVWALGSMVWSHAALAAVEAIRWFVFGLLLWLGLNTLARERLPTLALGIHWGAVVASFWTAAQFWVDFNVFPQGPNPASTFVNRNFFAEFAICTVPFSLLALAHAQGPWRRAVLAAGTGLVLVAIMMTGTRSALGAALVLLPVLAFVLHRYARHLPGARWSERQKFGTAALLIATAFVLGLVPTGNPKLQQEHAAEGRGLTPLARSFARVASMGVAREYSAGSFSIRMVMWKATGRMVAAHPLAGVGAGAWEVDIPLYQTADSQLETDYYVHNEFLQLCAEYGLVGWLFLLALAAYLLRAAWVTWRDRTAQGLREAPYRATVLASLLALMIVSNAGFPWRLASTGAMFALALGCLAASDARLGRRPRWLVAPLPWRPAFSRASALAMLACTVLAALITQQAILCESKIVRAVKIALTISQYGKVDDPRLDADKATMLRLVREGIAINPHYRKITPMVADELARWGDWGNAIWIWDSVAQSRPYVIAIMGNIARGWLQLGQPDRALPYLERSRRVQPDAPALRTLEVLYLLAQGRESDAGVLARRYLQAGVTDPDLLRASYRIGMRTKDHALALLALQGDLRVQSDHAGETWLRIGQLYLLPDLLDDAKALAAFRSALAAARPGDEEAMRRQIPAAYLSRL